MRKEFDFKCRDYRLRLGKNTGIMGVLNVSNGSFSKDAIYKDPLRARDKAQQMKEEGADIIDVGGESTRPGALGISPEEELKRVIPVIKELAKELKLPISIDTTKSEVARAALEEGASIVNDISGFKFDRQMADVAASFNAGCVLMHIQGTPRTMQENPGYQSLMDEIISYLRESVAIADSAGIDHEGLLLDPGIGFGKTSEHNLQIINRLNEVAALDLPILIGTSRKSFIGNVLNLPVEERLFGTAASVAVSIFNGAHIVRVHDVKEIAQVVKLTDNILNS
jgi:dihydropteroate synthase